MFRMAGVGVRVVSGGCVVSGLVFPGRAVAGAVIAFPAGAGIGSFQLIQVFRLFSFFRERVMEERELL
ncbi:hypothetical protein [Streptomyces sp. NPDC058272]|uniref:hypothetical protein n=1 Tax=Streptomyces sp. NPDC058272 TaxID=3346415 RepID=UPI0036E64F46